ncbi:MAG: hypothetical protein PHD21_05895 [Flavobacteriales bacterium]|nr:hypothetical protein [Flavobacteriales bacterium]
MNVEKIEKILELRIKYPTSEQGIKKYVDMPTDYVLRKRLHLNENQVQDIRMAYAVYQDKVLEVLTNRLTVLRQRRESRERNAV